MEIVILIARSYIYINTDLDETKRIYTERYKLVEF